MRKEKSAYNRNLLTESANDPNRFCSTLKRIFPSKKIAPISMTFDIGGKLTNNIKTMATSFCSFFINIASTLKSKAAPLKNFVWSNPKQNYVKTYSSFRFKDVQEKEVFKFLKNPSRKKSHWSRRATTNFTEECCVSYCSSFVLYNKPVTENVHDP